MNAEQLFTDPQDIFQWTFWQNFSQAKCLHAIYLYEILGFI